MYTPALPDASRVLGATQEAGGAKGAQGESLDKEAGKTRVPSLFDCSFVPYGVINRSKPATAEDTVSLTVIETDELVTICNGIAESGGSGAKRLAHSRRGAVQMPWGNCDRSANYWKTTACRLSFDEEIGV